MTLHHDELKDLIPFLEEIAKEDNPENSDYSPEIILESFRKHSEKGKIFFYDLVKKVTNDRYLDLAELAEARRCITKVKQDYIKKSIKTPQSYYSRIIGEHELSLKHLDDKMEELMKEGKLFRN